MQGINIIQGRHQLKHAKAPRYVDSETPASRQDQVEIWKLEEKETDVNISISMYRTAVKQSLLPEDERLQQLILVSADTDMGPALKALKEDFPHSTLTG